MLRDRARDFARHERFSAPRRFVVEQNAAARVQPVALAVIHRDPMRENFRATVGRARIERRGFLLRNFLHHPEHLARRRLVKPRFEARLPHRFEQPHRARARHVRRIFRRVETDAHMALRREIVNLLRLNFCQQPRQRAAVGQIAVVQEKPFAALVRVLVNRFEPPRVERAGAANDAVHLVAFAQQQFREIRPVLAGDAGD